ncbi:hypothetical protein PC9H_010951 [Pleurotus ostreatus]|uniref:Trehalase n=1 Tax=Pleurotus ostreatus TaxID=5322 RepID=A0A8H6ZKQ7_PLEOS|nr:uncharacterized protein PC9H_010951 [Pleurotus ostreatus]KAF7422792.1 hypothetical protein PC9H_010951 [Pleurotus ostreatus]
MLTSLAATLVALTTHGALAQTSSATAPGQSATSLSLPISTAVASPTASSGASLPSQVQLPPRQAWCPGEIFCAGELLQTVNLAGLFPDAKTFVDKPTSKRSQEVLNEFANLSSTPTFGEITNFVNDAFRGEGLELQALTLPGFKDSPAFLNNVTNPVVRSWTQIVHTYWNSLTRGTNETQICGQGPSATCESSLIPLNHTFVVPGGRFREQYYWDSFWIVEGLIESELFEVVNATLQNFMDEIETIGFIPNGGRTYYLNRSQPPVFIHMLERYITASGDTSILARALPLAERELTWWQENRSVNVTSPTTGRIHTMSHYNVNNTAPRPESYIVDYITANTPELPALNESQRANLYAELASGAETGWDYTARWLREPNTHGDAGLRTLNVRGTIAIDLNSILYQAHTILADLYSQADTAAATRHRTAATNLREGILDLCWNATKLAFYDFNLTSNTQSDFFSAAHFYPLWAGIIPDDLLRSPENAFGAFSTVNMVMNRYNGTYPSTFLDTGLQWDAPNAWPPHQYIILQALRNLPSNLTSGAIASPASDQSSFTLVPRGQIGLEENQLPGQPLHEQTNQTQNATLTGAQADLNRLDGSVVNGGNATQGEGWAQILQRELANRYITSAFCSWRATGGEVPGLVPRLSDAELNVTQSLTNTGNMFEKFSNLDIDSAGRGGEYVVQAGFGWTNGVALWVASHYGNVLNAPQCPNLLEGASGSSGQNNGGVVSWKSFSYFGTAVSFGLAAFVAL